jgi:gluconolactonase
MSWLKNVSLVLVATFCLTSVALGGDGEKLTTVKAKTLELQVPESWEFVKPSSNFRVAQFNIPAKEGEGTELVVFYFGGPTGGIAANIKRWIGQFQDDGRKVKLVHGECQVGRYVLADISGTWKKPDGPPFAQKTIDTPGSRVINVIIVKGEVGSEEYYFMKLSGPDKLVAQQAMALRKTFAAKTESERPYEAGDE